MRSASHSIWSRKMKLKVSGETGASHSLWLLMPILGETGCRLGEIVGLRVEDVDLEQDVIHIRPHALRRLKTTGSERSLPLVGHARTAIRQVMEQSEHGVLFPRYLRPEGMKTDHASCALSKWLKNRFGSLTAHCLRHTMRDRLREVEAPAELIDQIGGWSSSKTVGSSYGRGFGVEQLRTWLDRAALQVGTDEDCHYSQSKIASEKNA